MQRSERRKHALDVVLGKVQTRRLLETLVPHLVPQDGDADQLVADEQRLLDEHGAVLAHRIHDAHRRLHAHGRRRLGRDGQRVHERLRMGRADVRQEVVDEAADARRRCADARDHLRDDLEPRIDGDRAEALAHGVGDVLEVPELEPQGEQAQCVLQRVAARERNRAEEAMHTRHDARRDLV